ncbi:MAG: STAS domain-containing protein [Kiritimatiellae bacterium]|nr:STAS domain-containing protein [Kiritimatiellia bacterium]MDD4736896.1 STAS domain-containing protein [Kiritimatiellia bacterium]
MNRESDTEWVVIYMDDLAERPSRAVEIELARGTHVRRGVVLDIGGVDYVDSSGLGLLFSIKKELEDHGRELVLVNAKPAVRSALHLVHLEHAFPMYPDVTSAMCHVRRS